MDNENPVSKAIRVVGTQTELGSRCGVSYQAVQKWQKSGVVPAERVLLVERATGGQVTAHEMRPDVFGPIEQSEVPRQAEAG